MRRSKERVASPWSEMDRQSRLSMRTLRSEDVPTSAGVYALYREGERTYVGKAACLHRRVWKQHSKRKPVMTDSALRRNVAEHLGIATANKIKTDGYHPTAEEVARVRKWLDGCDVAWCECEDEPAASALERAMKAEYLPRLTRQ